MRVWVHWLLLAIKHVTWCLSAEIFKCCFSPKNSWKIHLKEWNNNDNLLRFFFLFFCWNFVCLSISLFAVSNELSKILWIAFAFYFSLTQFKVNLLVIQEWGYISLFGNGKIQEKKVLITLLLADSLLKQYVFLYFMLAAVIKHSLLSYEYSFLELF